MEAGLLVKMSACLNVYRAEKQHHDFVYALGKTDADFKKQFPHYAAIRKDIKELRDRNGQ